MATITSTILSAPAIRPAAAFAGLKAFDPYRPELHYMRGPGPAWRAKYGMDATFRLNSGKL